ncbi:MAG: DUF4288 domain-containing protein [Limisphaerales bacterium]
MNWYVAEVIVRCRVGKAPKRKALYDRQIKVLRASTHEAAYERALELGKAENHSYKNSAGEKVSWEFVGLGDLEALLDKKISDGTEIHSRLQRGNPKSIVRRKRDMTIFWAERNKHRTARELLNSATKPFAPS